MKLLLGGSPCTHWSIAQTKNRETEPEGMGWDLFKNYLIALEKFKPDFFLYENNKSMAPAIRAQITRELGVEPFAQPYRDYDGGDPSEEQKRFARWVNMKSAFNSCGWEEYCDTKRGR